MDLGEEEPAYVLEPFEDPVPLELPAEPFDEPAGEPVEPVREPT